MQGDAGQGDEDADNLVNDHQAGIGPVNDFLSGPGGNYAQDKQACQHSGVVVDRQQAQGQVEEQADQGAPGAGCLGQIAAVAARGDKHVESIHDRIFQPGAVDRKRERRRPGRVCSVLKISSSLSQARFCSTCIQARIPCTYFPEVSARAGWPASLRYWASAPVRLFIRFSVRSDNRQLYSLQPGHLRW